MMKTLKKALSALTVLTVLTTPNAWSAEFTLDSPAIAEGAVLNNEQVFEGFGCEGGNQSPELSWSGAPEGTKSFALTVYDPDAPTGSGWWHWNVVNIPSDASTITTGATRSNQMPSGSIELTNDYGVAGFGGACPPPGEVHRYQFTIHALGTESLSLPENASNALAGYMINANSIAKTTITAVYTR